MEGMAKRLDASIGWAFMMETHLIALIIVNWTLCRPITADNQCIILWKCPWKNVCSRHGPCVIEYKFPLAILCSYKLIIYLSVAKFSAMSAFIFCCRRCDNHNFFRLQKITFFLVCLRFISTCKALHTMASTLFPYFIYSPHESGTQLNYVAVDSRCKIDEAKEKWTMEEN